MAARFTYSRWDGTQRGFELDADALFDELNDDLLYHGDINSALRRLMQQGIASLDEVMPSPCRAVSLTAAGLLGEFIATQHSHDTLPPLLLGPDEESAQWVAQAASAHGLPHAWCVKQRHGDRDVRVTLPAGLPEGAVGTLGGRRITATATCAVLDDRTMAGSVLTMDGAFRQLVGPMGFALEDAAQMCATTQARQLGLSDCGSLVEGARADLVVLDAAGTVVQTYVAGRLVYARGVTGGNGAQPSSV